MESRSGKPSDKWCGCCKRWLPKSHFHKNRTASDGLVSRCKTCARTKAAAHYKAHRESHLAANRAWYAANKAKSNCSSQKRAARNITERRATVRESGKRCRRRLREEVFSAYGGAICACCGEKEFYFLTIDHVNNDGHRHRREVNCGQLCRWLKKNGFPSGFQVLCRNCNWGKYAYGGVCPHKMQKET